MHCDYSGTSFGSRMQVLTQGHAEHIPRSGLYLIPCNITTINNMRPRLTFGSNGWQGVNLEQTDSTSNGDEQVVSGDIPKIALRANFRGYTIHSLHVQAFRVHGSCRTGITREIVARKVTQLMNEFVAKVEALRPEFHTGLFGGAEGLQPRDLYLLRLEPVGKRIFDCVLGYYPRVTHSITGEHPSLSSPAGSSTQTTTFDVHSEDSSFVNHTHSLASSHGPRDPSATPVLDFSPLSLHLRSEDEVRTQNSQIDSSGNLNLRVEPPMHHPTRNIYAYPSTAMPMNPFPTAWAAHNHMQGLEVHQSTAMTFDSCATSLIHRTDSRQFDFHATQVIVASTRSPDMPSALASDEDTGVRTNHIPSWSRAAYTNTSLSQYSDMRPAQYPGQSIPGGNTASVYTSHVLPSPSAIATLAQTRAGQRGVAPSNSDRVVVHRDVQHTAITTAVIPGFSATYHSDGTGEPGWTDDSWNL